MEKKKKIYHLLIESVVVKGKVGKKSGKIKIKPRNLAALNLEVSDFKSLSIDPQLLRGTNGNANYFTLKVVAYSYRQGLLLEDDYTFILSSTVKPSKETKLERRMRYSLLMKENGWTRAELSRQLGVSRAWVTMTLG